MAAVGVCFPPACTLVHAIRKVCPSLDWQISTAKNLSALICCAFNSRIRSLNTEKSVEIEIDFFKVSHLHYLSGIKNEIYIAVF